MIKDAYVQYQSRKAAKDQFDAMELLPGRVKMERNVHYIDDETAAMNLHLALMMAALGTGYGSEAVHEKTRCAGHRKVREKKRDNEEGG